MLTAIPCEIAKFMKKIFFLIFSLLMSFNTFSQENSMLDYINTKTPTYPNCENSPNKSECFQTSIGELILKELNESNKLNAIYVDKIEIELLIRVESTGKSTILRLTTKQKDIEKIAKKALEKLPIITPIYSEQDKESKTSSQGFYILISKRNNSFELINSKFKEDLSLKPYPDFKNITNVVFPNCEKEEKINYKSCFVEQFKIWINNNIRTEIIKDLKGQTGILSINFDTIGRCSFFIKSESQKLKDEISLIIKKMPKVKPAEMNNEKIKIAYTIPLEF